jgi:CHASE2 domain-containing sensor protein
MIDQTSVDCFAESFEISWPWPRSMYAPVMQFLAKACAKGVSFDIYLKVCFPVLATGYCIAEGIRNAVKI